MYVAYIRTPTFIGVCIVLDYVVPDLCFLELAHITSRTPKFWHTCMITYSDLMIIAKPCKAYL